MLYGMQLQRPLKVRVRVPDRQHPHSRIALQGLIKDTLSPKF